jgi:hypothetical protein
MLEAKDDDRNKSDALDDTITCIAVACLAEKIQKQRILDLQPCSMVMTRVIRSTVILVGAALLPK